jgi:FkbM family methyltransferase
MKWIRSLVKQALKRLGYRLVPYSEPCQKPLDILGLAARERLSRGEDFYFVQIGANDGMRYDPLRALILEHHLRGLLVEPLPDAFAQLRKNYAGEPQLLFENAAVASENGEKTLYRIRPSAPVADWVHGLARFDKASIIRTARELGVEQYVEEVRVPALTFGALLQKHRVGQITLLQIDTEGYDYEVLKMAFAANVCPEIIHYEFINLSPSAGLAAHRLLADKGYRFLDEDKDTLAIREE